MGSCGKCVRQKQTEGPACQPGRTPREPARGPLDPPAGSGILYHSIPYYTKYYYILYILYTTYYILPTIYYIPSTMYYILYHIPYYIVQYSTVHTMLHCTVLYQSVLSYAIPYSAFTACQPQDLAQAEAIAELRQTTKRKGLETPGS